MTTFEKLGIEYKEYDGLLYPVLSVSEEAVNPIHNTDECGLSL